MTHIERLLFFTLTGLLITLAISSYVIILGVAPTLFIEFMLLMFCLGFCCRVLRRKLFFGTDLTFHQALSFEALFQGAIALYPQLPYPAIEQAFIRRHMELPISKIQRWFSIRQASALVIPLALLGAILGLSGHWSTAIFFWGLGALITLYFAGLIFVDEHSLAQASRFALAVIAGLVAIWIEGWLWIEVAHLIDVSVPSWELLILYSLTLTLFEISPIPLGLGIIEVAFFFISAFFGFTITLIALPLAYRLFRATPIILMMIFYLPRYKLALTDLYDPGLEMALSAAWHKPRQMQRDASNPLLSIIIPAYNEALRLPSYLSEVIQFTRSFSDPTEIIVVDDGSKDGTGRFVRSLMPSVPHLHFLVQPQNAGKGAAVKRGVLSARGDYILFTDADGSTPIGEAGKLLGAAYEGGDVVIASRRLIDSVEERSFFRGLSGSIFYRLTNLLAVPGIADTQCGFKLFPRESAMRLFSSLREDGWAFDVELLYLAQKLGMTIVEVPVHWTAMAGSKVQPLRDAARMLIALMRIRKRWKGMSGS